MQPDQELEYHNMKMNYERLKEESKELKKIYKVLMKLIPKETMLKELKKSKMVQRRWV